MTDKPFFIGYAKVPLVLRVFLGLVSAVLIGGAAVLGYAIGSAQDDPGDGAFRFDFGRQTVTGVVELTPLPVLHVTQGTERIPAGHTLMLSGAGKNGAISRATDLDGQVAQASGVLLNRGDIDMLQLRGGRNGLSAAEGDGTVPAPVDLGVWKLAGEICDGKCLSGAMRPGRGIAHRACANLCLEGGIPPVFVSTQPVEGSEFLMLTGPQGGPLPQAIYDNVALYITAEGRISRHGDLLIWAMQPDTIEVLP